MSWDSRTYEYLWHLHTFTSTIYGTLRAISGNFDVDFQQPIMWWNTISHKSPIGDGQFEIGKNIKWYPAQIEMNIAGLIGLFHTFQLFSASVFWGMIAVYFFFTEHIFPLVSKDPISKISKDWPRAYPLVNSHSCWKSPFLVAKSTINGHFQYRMGPPSCKLVYKPL